MRERYFSAAELADFEYCPLAWWEEQTNSLADLTPMELAAHLDELRQRYGENAALLPEYQLVVRLQSRHGVLDAGHAAHEAHANQVATSEHLPQLLAWRAALLVTVIIVLVAGLLVWLH